MTVYLKKRLAALCTCMLLLCVSYGVHGQTVNVDSRFLALDISAVSSVPAGALVGFDDRFLYVLERGSEDEVINVFSRENKRDEPTAVFSLDKMPDTLLSLGKGVLLVDFEKPTISRLVYDSLQRDHVVKEIGLPEFIGGLRDVQLVGDEIFITAYGRDENDEQHTLWSEKIGDQTAEIAWRTSVAYPTNDTAVKFVKQQGSVFKAGSDGIHRLDNDSNRWIFESDFLADREDITVSPLGPFHLLFLVKHQNSSDTVNVYLYHTVTKQWTKEGEIDYPSATFAATLASNGQMQLIIAGENGAASCLKLTAVNEVIKLNPLDYITLVVYFIGLYFVSHYFSRRKNTSDEYFKGGKRVPWYASGISIVATKLSAVSFVSLPAKAFVTNWTYLLIPLGNIAIAWFVAKYVVPFFCRLNVTSAYEYLEKRFNVAVRTLASLNFLVFELVKIGVLFIVPAVVLNVTAGVDVIYSVMIIGVFTTLYTVIGGIEGVIWTEAAQVIIMIGGTLLAIIIILLRLDYDVPLLDVLKHEQKLKTVDFSWDFSKATLLVIVLYWLGSLKNYISNQTIIQRYIVTRDEKQANKGIWFANLVNIPVIWLFLALGTAMYLFYHQHPKNVNPVMDQPDALLPWFIILDLPPGVSGLLIAGIFAASMSTLESSLSSMSTVLVADFYKRFSKTYTESKAVRLGKIIIMLLGTLGTVIGGYLATFQIPSLYDKFFELIGLFGGGLGGLFLLGMMTDKANSKGTIIGFVLSGITQYLIAEYTNLHFFTYLFFGMASCFIFGYLVSLILPGDNKKLNGLTVHNM